MSNLSLEIHGREEAADLGVPKFFVEAFFFEKVFVRAVLDNFAFVEDKNAVHVQKG